MCCFVTNLTNGTILKSLELVLAAVPICFKRQTQAMETAKSTGLSCGTPIFCSYGPLHVYHREIDTEIFVFYDEMTLKPSQNISCG